MVMLDKYSHQLNQCDQKSSTLGHLIKKKVGYHPYLHSNYRYHFFKFFIVYNHLLHGIILCKILYWKVWIFVSLTVLKGSLNILFQIFESAVLKSG